MGSKISISTSNSTLGSSSSSISYDYKRYDLEKIIDLLNILLELNGVKLTYDDFLKMNNVDIDVLKKKIIRNQKIDKILK